MTNKFDDAARQREIWIEHLAAELVNEGWSPWGAIHDK